jgi:hypothetical protein
MPAHKNVPTDEIHALGPQSTSDPGAIGAGKFWFDTNYSPPMLKVRNSDDDGWIPIGAILVMDATQTVDTAPDDNTTYKKLTLQKLASPPSSAAYIAFSNSPGSDTFYLVMTEADND